MIGSSTRTYNSISVFFIRITFASDTFFVVELQNMDNKSK